MERRIFSAAVFFALFAVVNIAQGKICPKCGHDHLPDDPPKAADPPAPAPTKDAEKEPEENLTLSVARARFFATSVEIADAADAILDRLVERYGAPKVWEPFPIYFRRYKGDGVAGYTLYQYPNVKEVVVYESLADSVGATLDHELTHAFFFYYLNSNFDLMLNEGLAQNSEYRRRESLRQTVYRRYSSGDFWDLSKLYGRNRYDSGLLVYHQGFSVVDFLIGRGGSQWFAAFMSDLVASDNIDATLLRYYGYKDLKELQSAWIEYIERGQDRAALRAVK